MCGLCPPLLYHYSVNLVGVDVDTQDNGNKDGERDSANDNDRNYYDCDDNGILLLVPRLDNIDSDSDDEPSLTDNTYNQLNRVQIDNIISNLAWHQQRTTSICWCSQIIKKLYHIQINTSLDLMTHIFSINAKLSAQGLPPLYKTTIMSLS